MRKKALIVRKAKAQKRKEERRARQRSDVESTYYFERPDGTTSEMRLILLCPMGRARRNNRILI